MAQQSKKERRRFQAHVEARAYSLNGTLLATFWQRLLGYCVDLLAAVSIWFPLEFSWRHFVLHETNIHIVWDFHETGNIVVMVLYWGLSNYFGNGQTLGKWVARTRASSLKGGPHGTVAIHRAGARVWSCGAGVRSGVLAVLLGP